MKSKNLYNTRTSFSIFKARFGFIGCSSLSLNSEKVYIWGKKVQSREKNPNPNTLLYRLQSHKKHCHPKSRACYLLKKLNGQCIYCAKKPCTENKTILYYKVSPPLTIPNILKHLQVLSRSVLLYNYSYKSCLVQT